MGGPVERVAGDGEVVLQNGGISPCALLDEECERALHLGEPVRIAEQRTGIAAVAECTGRPLDLEYLPARACDARQIVLDTTRLRAVVPFEPRSLRNGIDRTWSELTTEPCAIVA